MWSSTGIFVQFPDRLGLHMNHFSSRYSGKIFKKYSNFSNIRVLTNWNANKKENPSEPKMLYGAAPLVKMPSAKHLQRKLEINDFILKSQSSLQLPRSAKKYLQPSQIFWIRVITWDSANYPGTRPIIHMYDMINTMDGEGKIHFRKGPGVPGRRRTSWQNLRIWHANRYIQSWLIKINWWDRNWLSLVGSFILHYNKLNELDT